MPGSVTQVKINDNEVHNLINRLKINLPSTKSSKGAPNELFTSVTTKRAQQQTCHKDAAIWKGLGFKSRAFQVFGNYHLIFTFIPALAISCSSVIIAIIYDNNIRMSTTVWHVCAIY